jgi:hypothetical protein
MTHNDGIKSIPIESRQANLSQVAFVLHISFLGYPRRHATQISKPQS